MDFHDRPYLTDHADIQAPPEYGNWTSFEETKPNLEVRIGAIYALERIAQDSDRDHVQIMEILCAYIRQNASAPQTDDWPQLEMKESEDDGPLEADWEERLEAFRKEQKKAKAGLQLREDIQVALTVLGRRRPEQRLLEARAGDAKEDAVFVLDLPCPEYDGPEDGHDPAALDAYRKALEEWNDSLLCYEGYQLDLRNSDLRGADLSGLNLNGAKLTGTYLQGADLTWAHLQWADLRGARLQGADIWEARLQGADLWNAWLQGVDLADAQLQGADLRGARLQGAALDRALLQGTDLTQARLQAAVLEKTQMHGARFWEARLQSANLRWAQLQRADLSGAQLQRADLSVAQLHGVNFGTAQLHGMSITTAQLHAFTLGPARLGAETELTAASLSAAAVSSVDFLEFPQIAGHLKRMFGDGTVTLPEGCDWPAHWPRHELDPTEFIKKWRKWQADPGAYEPPEDADEG